MRAMNMGSILEDLVLYGCCCVILFLAMSAAAARVHCSVKRQTYLSSLKSIFPPALLLSYCFIYLYATIFARAAGMTEGFYLIPFHSIAELNVQGANGGFLIIVSIAVGIPIGFLLPVCLKKTRQWWKVGCIAIGFALIIESVQLLTGRDVFDIDDVLFLLIGALLGKMFYQMYKRSSFIQKQPLPAAH